MNTVPAQEIKRRGISAVDEGLNHGPVHVIKNNRPQYVVLTEGRYQELVSEVEDAYITRVQASLEDIKSGRVKRGTVQELLQEIGMDE